MSEIDRIPIRAYTPHLIYCPRPEHPATTFHRLCLQGRIAWLQQCSCSDRDCLPNTRSHQAQPTRGSGGLDRKAALWPFHSRSELTECRSPHPCRGWSGCEEHIASGIDSNASRAASVPRRVTRSPQRNHATCIPAATRKLLIVPPQGRIVKVARLVDGKPNVIGGVYQFFNRSVMMNLHDRCSKLPKQRKCFRLVNRHAIRLIVTQRWGQIGNQTRSGCLRSDGGIGRAGNGVKRRTRERLGLQVTQPGLSHGHPTQDKSLD